MIPRMKFDAVLFDCDGVLVDSEAITNGVLRDMFEELGWRMTLAECMGHFVGHTVRSRQALIEANTGQPFTEEWLQSFYARRNAQLDRRLTAIPHIEVALAHVQQRLGDKMACASGADRGKLDLVLARVGLAKFFGSRVFSGHEMPRSKPFPDVYLAAAAHLQVDPARCLVVEDTPVGVTAGVAAGATVWGYAVHGQDDSLRAAGAAHVFRDMRDLLALA